MEEAKKEVIALKKKYKEAIKKILSEDIEAEAEDFAEELKDICKRHNLSYDYYGEEKEKGEYWNMDKELDFVVKTFINNNFIQQAISSDPCGDWDGYVRFEKLEQGLRPMEN
jgi:hypothetical protein